MKKTPKNIQIANAQWMDKHILKLQFSDKTIQSVNFQNFLENSTHPEIRKYLKIHLFKKFKIRDGELMWGDFDLIFPIADLYHNQIEKQTKPLRKVS